MHQERLGGANPKDLERQLFEEDVRIILRALTDRELVDDLVDPDFKRFVPKVSLPMNLHGLPPLLICDDDKLGRAPIHGGGRGVVFRCRHTKLGEKFYAIKFQRPSLLANVDAKTTATEQDHEHFEIIQSAKLSHPNTAHLIGTSELTVRIPSGLRVPVWVMLFEWVRGVPLPAYLEHRRESGAPAPAREIARLLAEVLSALHHVHSQGLVHWDLKADNCFVTDEGIVKLMDIGNSQKMAPHLSKYSGDHRAYTSKQNAPGLLKSLFVGEEGASNRMPVHLRSGAFCLDRPWLDLWMFGQMFGRLLGFFRDDYSEDPEIISKRLSSSFQPEDEFAQMCLHFLWFIHLRLTPELSDHFQSNPEETCFYSSALEVSEQISKIRTDLGPAEGVTELLSIPQHVVRLPVSRNLPHTRRTREVIDLRLIQRLKKHRQLGLTHYVYPGATHSRFEHSLGVFGITMDYVSALISDLPSPFFRLLADKDDIDALLFASLLHDAGHYAFAHYLEECKALFGGCSHEDYVQAVLRNDPNLFASGSASPDIASDHLGLVEAAKMGWTNREAKAFLIRAADILRPPTSLRPYFESEEGLDLSDRKQSDATALFVLHSILDGVIDGDKLDYLRRDGHHSGLDYALGADVDRFLQGLTVAIHSPGGDALEFRPTIAVTRKGVLPVESLLLARYQSFASLYWHPRARSSTVLLQYLIWRYLQPIGVEPEKNDWLQYRSILLTEFRDREDDEAIRWLEKAVLERNARAEASVRSRLQALVEALRSRSNLPEPVLDAGPGQLIGAGFRDEGQRMRLEEIFEMHIDLNRLKPERYAAVRKEIVDTVSKQLKPLLRGIAGSVEPDELSVFLDIPYGTKDQVKNLFVVDRPSFAALLQRRRQAPLGRFDEAATSVRSRINSYAMGRTGGTYAFESFSTMGGAIKDAFNLWARRARVFVVPGLKQALLSEADEEDVARTVFSAIYNAYREHVGPSIGGPNRAGTEDGEDPNGRL
jgi:HD superfamily phosphohydrolase